MAASFQETINEILRIKCSKAMDMFLDLQPKLKNKNFVVAGGVASNKSIRNNLIKLSRSKDFTIIFPPSKLCTDNAVMIAWAGIKHYQIPAVVGSPKLNPKIYPKLEVKVKNPVINNLK